MKLESKNLRALFDETGMITSLTNKKYPNVEWIQRETSHFGQIFVNGTQISETYLAGQQIINESQSLFTSESGASSVRFILSEDQLHFSARLPKYTGPRVGIDFSFNLLDTPGDDWQNQCMPTVIYTDDSHSFFYIIFYSTAGRYLTLLVDSPFSAWRIKYSPQGHKMQGFQVLSEADDLLSGKSGPHDSLRGIIFFSDSLTQAYEKIADHLECPLISFDLSGTNLGNTLPLHWHGEKSPAVIQTPSGQRITVNTPESIHMTEPGTYKIETRGTKYRHQTILQSLVSWQEMSVKTTQFYLKHFQDPCGAFYRAIWSDTLSPEDGVTYEGIAFGDPNKMISCKTGEFGGFAGWMMIKEAQNQPSNLAALHSAQRYIENWALNLSPEAPIHPGSIASFPQEFGGREYGAYHLYHDYNYPQYEIFLIEQLVDYYQLTEKAIIRQYAINIGKHFVEEHIDPNLGFVWCQNKQTSIPRDYSTVHTPITGLNKLAEICEENTDICYFKQAAENLADYIAERGLNFPTEGEQATEDGSMACSALSLLYAYKYLNPKEIYLKTAQLILDRHRVLELQGTDARMFQSSLRFWETLYETRDWGPSINSGHAWTLWTAEAKLLLGEITHDFQAIREAYAGFITNVTKIDDSGGMRCCYTPDIMPGTPHEYDIYLKSTIKTGDFRDIYETSVQYAHDFPSKTYSSSGTYLFIKAAEYWQKFGAISFSKRQVINGRGAKEQYTFDLRNHGTIFIEGIPDHEVTISLPLEATDFTIIPDKRDSAPLRIALCDSELVDGCYKLSNIKERLIISAAK